MSKYNERILEDEYPVHIGYLYVLVDGEAETVVRCGVSGTVKDIKDEQFWMNDKEIEVKNCDIGGRDLWKYAI